MGQAKQRKNADGSYKSIKGDDYKLDQWRFIVRFKKFMAEKRRKK